MDPDATLRDLLDALNANDYDRVHELSAVLLGWLSKNGFPPTTIGDPNLGKAWHRAVATFICQSAQSRAEKFHSRRLRKRTP